MFGSVVRVNACCDAPALRFSLSFSHDDPWRLDKAMVCGRLGSMRAMRKQGGFTLIELIVVIAILAVLMGISSPLLFSYMNSGDVVKCRANIDQLAKLGIKYGQDMATRNLLPTSGMADDEDTPAMKESDGWWLSLAQELDSTVLPIDRQHKMKVATIFHCPGDHRATVNDGTLMEATERSVSYVSWTDGSEDEHNPNSQIRTVGKKHLDMIPWLSDGNPEKGKSVTSLHDFKRMVVPAIGRHRNTIMVAYASGVVQQFEVEDDEEVNASKLFLKINPEKRIPTKKRKKRGK